MSYVLMGPDALCGTQTLLTGIKISRCKNASIKYNLWENTISLFLAFPKAYSRFLRSINVLSEHYFPKIRITNLILAMRVLLQ